ncbi:MAG: hypothetical protein WBG76_14015 [Ornithinimicrobium sp.]
MTRSQNRRSSFVGGAAAGLALTLGLAACGSDTEPVEDEGQTQNGAALADVEPGDQVEPSDLLDRLSSPGAETLNAFDFAVLAMAEGEQIAISGAVDLAGDSPALEVSMDLPPMGVVDLLLVEGSAYANIPGLTPEGKYLEIPAQELDNLGAQDLTNTLDLDSLMDTWDSSAQEVTFVGTEEINGNETDHYELELDPQKVLDEMGQTAAPDLGSELGLDMDLAGAGTYGIWIGEDNLIRQMVIGSEESAVTITLDNWGQDLKVEVPDAADVVEIPGF